MNTLFIDQAYLIERTIIDDNVDYEKAMPEIEIIQNLNIRPLLGTDLYTQLITQIEASPTPPYTGLSADNKILLYDHLQNVVCQYLLARLAVTGHYRQTNTGVQTRTPDGSQAAELATIKYLVDFKNNTAEALANLMCKFLQANPDRYPAYRTKTLIDGVIPNSDAFNCDIFLEDRCDNINLDPYYYHGRHNKKRPF